MGCIGNRLEWRGGRGMEGVKGNGGDVEGNGGNGWEWMGLEWDGENGMILWALMGKAGAQGNEGNGGGWMGDVEEWVGTRWGMERVEGN